MVKVENNKLGDPFTEAVIELIKPRAREGLKFLPDTQDVVTFVAGFDENRDSLAEGPIVIHAVACCTHEYCKQISNMFICARTLKSHHCSLHGCVQSKPLNIV